MKKQTPFHPARAKFSVLRQLCNLIPPHLVPRLARESGAQKKARGFSPWSHLVSLLYAQLAHALSLNDVCDSLQMHRGPLSTLRGATPPSRNGLSHANKHRPASMAEALFWELLQSLTTQSPAFARSGPGKNWARRFHRAIHLVDATTIQLVAACMDWAQHRRRKAAAKCHLRLDLHSFLPRFVLIDTAREHEVRRAREVCAGLRAGEIAVLDKGYLDLAHLHDLHQRGVWWVTRAKERLGARVVKKRAPAHERILADEIIELHHFNARRDYPARLRRVVALVEVNGEEREMIFLTNHLEWSASSVADLYRCRWNIEVFFKQMKQTLQLADFLGHSANAVRWQVWSALLLFLLMRYAAWQSRWTAAWARLFTVVRAACWQKWELWDLLRGYGTARCAQRFRAQPEQAYFAGF